LVHVCCGQMAEWIKMPLGMEVRLGPHDFVLDGDAAPLSNKGAEPPNFRPTAGWMKMALGHNRNGPKIGRELCPLFGEGSWVPI